MIQVSSMRRVLTQIAFGALIATSCGGVDNTSGPSSDADHGHSHGAGHDHGAGAVESVDAKLVAATADSPAFTQLGPGVEVIGDVAVAAGGDSSTFTHEGHFAPLLFGSDLRAFTLRLEPGMFLAEHPHPTESMVYTVSGRWVLCSGGNRKVMEPGSLFHFGPDAPTGWEAPFQEGAQVLIVKTIREDEDYAMFCEGMRELASKLEGRHTEGEVFYFNQLEENHPAITFARAQGASVDRVRSVVPEAPSNLVEIERDAVRSLNADLVPGPLTMDVGILIPSNLDPAFDLVTPAQMLDGVRSAKEIFGAVGVQIRLLWVKTGPVPEEHLSITSTASPAKPASKHTGMYMNLKRNAKPLSDGAKAAFEALVPRDEESHRTIYLVVLQDVFYPYFAPTESGGDFVAKVTPTSGLSFPPYIHGSEIPRHLRGVITLSNLTVGENRFKTIAHEIGHKTLNVSHEYRDVDPEFEVVGEGGLMIYGSGVEIPSGADGRWHRERLELSPFLYREDESGEKTWNPDFQEGGHYFDPIYGDFTR